MENKEINKVIKSTAERTAEEVVTRLKNKNMLKNPLTYTRKVEIILYNYNNLKEAINEKNEAIEEIKKYGIPSKSKSITTFSSSSTNNTHADRYIELIEKYEFEKKETIREIKRIEKALSKIKKDKYYNIIKVMYINKNKLVEEGNNYTYEMLAEEMKVDRKTITRNKYRLINKIAIILFPEYVSDLM